MGEISFLDTVSLDSCSEGGSFSKGSLFSAPLHPL